jgi:hypothetical protein
MQDTVGSSTPKPRVGIEGLDAYRVAVEFYRLLRQSTRGRRGHAIDQGHRAAESVVRNIAEAYPMAGLDRMPRFRIAGCSDRPACTTRQNTGHAVAPGPRLNSLHST